MNPTIIEELKIDMGSYQKKTPAQLLARESTAKKAWALKKLGYTSFRMNSPCFLLDIWRRNCSKDFEQVVDSVLALAKGRCVEIGNSLGTMSRFMLESKKVKSVEYFDLNRENERFARFSFERHGEKVKIHPTMGSIVAQSKYDTFVLIDVLESMKNPEDFLVTLFNHLRRYGRIIITYDFQKEPNFMTFQHWKTYEEMEEYMSIIGFKKGKDLPGVYEFWRSN
jgi:2-polyprenyl-3-methyl-5-hydroxy-6-metoxy-1,4-benzoquinol methylase